MYIEISVSYNLKMALKTSAETCICHYLLYIFIYISYILFIYIIYIYKYYFYIYFIRRSQ